MRLTRAAQRAQQTTDEVVDAPVVQERAPLNEISPNASPELILEQDELPQKTPTKKTKAKGGAKKGKKGKKGKAVEDEPVQVVREDEREAAGSPASEAAVEELAKEPSNGKRSRCCCQM